MNYFCRNIRYLRRVHGMSVKEMAEVLGVSVRTYRRIEGEAENVRVRAGMLCRVCDYFGISTDAMLLEVLEDL